MELTHDLWNAIKRKLNEWHSSITTFPHGSTSGGDHAHPGTSIAPEDIVGGVASDATDVTYTPTTPGDWDDPDPASVQEALDDLAGSGGGAALTVQEVDGAPLDSAVTIIRVPNGTLTDNGAGDVSLRYVDDDARGLALMALAMD